MVGRKKSDHKKRISEALEESERILSSIEVLTGFCRFPVGDSQQRADVQKEDLEYLDKWWENVHSDLGSMIEAIICGERSSVGIAEFHLRDMPDNKWLWPIIRATGHQVAWELIIDVLSTKSEHGDDTAIVSVELLDPLELERLHARLERENAVLSHFLHGLGENGNIFFEKFPVRNKEPSRSDENKECDRLMSEHVRSNDLKRGDRKRIAEKAVKSINPNLKEGSSTFQAKVRSVERYARSPRARWSKSYRKQID